MNMDTVLDLFRRHAKVAPGKLAVQAPDGKLTYRELDELSDRLAGELLHNQTGREQVTGILDEPSIRLIVSVLGILKSGGCYLPLDPSLPKERLQYIIRNSGIKSIVTSSGNALEFSDLAVRLMVCQPEDLAQRISPVSEALPLVTPDHLAYVIYTSGSTGNPKGVMIGHKALMTMLEGYRDLVTDSPDIRLLSVAPFTFDPSVIEFFFTLCSGGTLFLSPRGSLVELSKTMEFIAGHEINAMYLPPVVLQQFARLVESGRYLLQLKWLLVGVEPIRQGLLETIRKSIPGITIINAYGPTEATVIATAHCFSGASDPGRRTPIGRPLKGYTVILVDENFKPVEAGEEGQILIAGNCLAKGYLNEPGLTDASFRMIRVGDQPLRRFYLTGDFGTYLGNGEIEFTGRKDDQVKIRGFRIETVEVEAAVIRHPLIVQASVMAFRNESENKSLVCFYTTGNGQPIEDLREWLARILPEYMLPSSYFNLERIPETDRGKIDRRFLEHLYYSAMDSENLAGTGNHIAGKLADIYKVVLNISALPKESSLIDLGGDSISAMVLLARIEEEMGVRVPLEVFNRNSSVESMEKIIEQYRSDSQTISSNDQEEKADDTPIPLSVSQQELWVLNELDPTGITYNIVARIRITGVNDGNRIAGAVKIAFGRYDIFAMAMVHSEQGVVMMPVPEAEITVHITDLRSLSPAGRNERIESFERNAGKSPFILTAPPLFRLDLMLCEEGVSLLYLTVHHLIFDGWSLGILMHDILHLLSEDTAIHPTSPMIPGYQDYARWSRQMMDQGWWNSQLAYWKEKLMDIPPPMMFHRLKKTQGITGAGSRYPWEIPEELYGEVQNFAKHNGLTRFSVLLSAFGLLLRQLIRRDRIMIGTAYANRTIPKYQKIPGYFTNMVALIISPDPGISVMEYLSATGTTASEAFSNAGFPFGALVKELRIINESNQPSFFEAMFIMQNWVEGSYAAGKILMDQQEIGNHTAKTDLLFNVTETGKSCDCWFEYPQELFSGKEMGKMVLVFLKLLETIIRDPEKSLAEIGGHEQVFPVAHLIGSGTLLTSCCDHLLGNGWVVASVTTEDEFTGSYCRKLKIPVRPVAQGLEELGKEQQACYLFSIVNPTIIPADITGNRWITAVNYHDSLLPANAGLNATSWALVNGDKVHGISWHLVSPVIDGGDLMYQQTIEVNPGETAESLNLRCYEEAQEGFRRMIARIADGTLKPIPQQSSGRSYHGQSDRPGLACLVDFSPPAVQLASWTAAMTFPNTINEFGLPRIHLDDRWYLLPFIETEEEVTTGVPGLVISAQSGKLVVVSGAGSVSIRRVLDSYGRPLQLEEWYHLHQIKQGIRLPAEVDYSVGTIRQLNRSLIRHEPYWAGRLKRHQPLKLPFIFPRPETDEPIAVDHARVPFVSFPDIYRIAGILESKTEETIFPAVLLFLAKLLDQNEFEIPYGRKRNNLLPQSYFIPLWVSVNPGDDCTTSIVAISALMNEQFAKGSFYADLFLRYPSIYRKPAGEGFFSSQFFLCEDEPGDALREFDGSRILFILNKSEACLDIRCYGSFPYNHPAEFLATRLAWFAEKLSEKDVIFREISLVNAEDLRIIMQEMNPPGELEEASAGFLTMFCQIAGRFPDQPAIRSQERFISYLQLDVASDKIASILLAEGFSSGEIAGVLLERSPMLIAAMVGILKAGGAFLPVDPEFPGERMEQIVQISSLNWMITGNSHRGSVPDTISHILVPEDDLFYGIPQPSGTTFEPPGMESPAYVIFTSGTTGKPKGVLISHRALACFIGSATKQYGLTSGDKVLQFASIAFDTAIEEIFPALCSGACVVLRNHEMIGSAGTFLQMTGQWEITVMDLPTAYWHQLIRNMHMGQLSFPDCLRLVIIGGEKAKPEILRLWEEVAGDLPVLINTYGPTETTVVSTLHRHTTRESTGDFPIGKPLDSVRVLVCDNNLNPVLPYLPGELLIGGPQAASGFSGEEERYGRSFVRLDHTPYPGLLFFRSGDRVWYDERGLLYHLGRKDQQVKIRGFRVDPFEIDHLLSRLDGITGSVTIAFGEEDKKKLACYYTRNKAINLTLAHVRSYLISRLPEYMMPSFLAEVEEFPLTINRKIDVAALPSPLDEAGQKSMQVPESATEKRLIELFTGVLPGVEIGPGSNFFDLGGDSLDAVNLLSGISRVFDYNLSLRRFYELTSLRALASELDSCRATTGSPQPEVTSPIARHISLLKPGGSRMPLFIVYGDRANHFLPGLIGHDRPLFTLLPQGADGEAITASSVEAIASMYLGEILVTFGSGPFHLAGFSFGGLIALEMALQLRDAGMESGRVTVIDTAAPHLFRSIVHKVSLRKRLEGWVDWLVAETCVKSGKSIPPRYRNSYVLRSFRKAAYLYNPSEPRPPLPFRMIRSAHSVSDEHDLGWSEWKGFTPEITVIDGDHFSIVRNEELVGQYAGRLVEE